MYLEVYLNIFRIRVRVVGENILRRDMTCSTKAPVDSLTTFTIAEVIGSAKNVNEEEEKERKRRTTKMINIVYSVPATRFEAKIAMTIWESICESLKHC